MDAGKVSASINTCFPRQALLEPDTFEKTDFGESLHNLKALVKREQLSIPNEDLTTHVPPLDRVTSS